MNVKLSGDGTRIGKRLHVVLFTFKLLEEEQYCSTLGNHILAIFKQPKSYESLSIMDAKQLTEIVLNRVKFYITYHLEVPCCRYWD